MSLEVLLIPIGIAAVAAWRESRSTDLCERCRATGISDQTLLLESLQAMGITIGTVTDGWVQDSSRHGLVTLQRLGDAFLGRVDADDTATQQLLAELETATGTVTQDRNVRAVRAKATERGLRLIGQLITDGEIQLAFEEAR